MIGRPVRMGGLLIEITLDSGDLRTAMIDYGLRILWLSLVISVITAVLLFWAVHASSCARSGASSATCRPMPPPPRTRAT